MKSDETVERTWKQRRAGLFLPALLAYGVYTDPGGQNPVQPTEGGQGQQVMSMTDRRERACSPDESGLAENVERRKRCARKWEQLRNDHVLSRSWSSLCLLKMMTSKERENAPLLISKLKEECW